jgi:Flp pilus assembly pilin Flp
MNGFNDVSKVSDFFKTEAETILGLINRLVIEEDGQGMTEYIMIFMVIVIICMIGYQLFGIALNSKVTDIGSKI